MDMSSNDIKVSVIVPIWNSREKIRRCLDSLLNQTLKEIEVICVLDCPTDGTDKIVEQYAAKDSRVVVLKNESNLQVSRSRNRGLETAKGKYVGFSDHDDYREDMTMYQTLYEKAEAEGSDIVLSNAAVIAVDRHVDIWKFSDISRHALLSANILPFEQIVNPQIITHCIWHSIYRKEMLDANHIRFKDRSVYLDEDRLFNFESYFSAKMISIVNKPFYVWDKRLDSLSNAREYNIAERQMTRSQFFVSYLREKDSLTEFLPDIQRLLALELRVYFKDYLKLDEAHMEELKSLWKDAGASPWMAPYGLKAISRKRLLIYKYWLRLFLNLSGK